jgi:ribosomal protein S18 acetylase RimI-like enzyme
MHVDEFDAETAARHLPALAAVMRDCVEGGASVNFVLPFTQAESEAWWRTTVMPALASGERRLLVAREGEVLLGSVQLAPAWQPNQRHRGDVTKLLVARAARRRGAGRALMLRIETIARESGRWLLTLDTTEGSAAQRLYESLGWQLLGVVPAYAMAPDRPVLEGAAFFWKDLR